ncbi:efflux RND transporter periplasmic adaptor subunit [Microbulbifer thermotolerans]|uniref:Efflux RND transporter periplasmic adaptor subunit n=1 Tax=Microbulbifer thermotolerans TaxID=252514 RepID=A0AB35HYD7_MICTH|nr:efflux RND transporter periplasmic adaptor subunit [Microbulbifer thermotolerans]MCX2778935.1 efflux RND transporter periplasmic adaptor subunit [Microbulbifer thermotolerans]MCX2781433.1 efflux RND transporter periplasmic adaptor subunit [Microbulbifer thermotolerans]MCX2793820.1 efflux RND transporter periplasmic adaptor subunit [Microbulbifer thermotolerans]MCX2802381.1 efflux RND transporter periplasmic adaptor subunit [Microbulbifer thermotolerans]MCX2804240.1 efflux RND transporter pe
MRPANAGRICCYRSAGIGLFFLALHLLAGCEAGSEAAPPVQLSSAQPVVTEAVAWQPRRVRIEAVGTSRAARSVTLYPQVSGEVVEVLFKAGDRVKAGQTILRLDDRDQRLAVAQARVALEDAERLYSRYERTRGSGTVTESALDDARSAVERARLSLRRAEVALDYRSIEAPFEGYLGITDLDPGAQVSPSTPITTIDDRLTLLVTFQVPELFLGQIGPGQSIDVATWANGSAEHTGKVTDIDSRVDPGTRTFAVRALVDNREDQLRPGMSFRVTLNLVSGRYPAVPEVALQWGNDGAFVWVVEEGRAKRVSATVVQRLQGIILVDANLPEGTPVVTEGTQRMREGLSVVDIAEV